jgi:hypothetical protein
MHKRIFIFILLLSSLTTSFSSLRAAEAAKEQKNDLSLTEFSQEDLVSKEDELTKIDTLIKATEASLARQKKLREQLEEYRKVEAACIARPKDATLLVKLAKTGSELYDTIISSYLTDYFPQEFIKELQKLKTIGDKKSIPPARS